MTKYTLSSTEHRIDAGKAYKRLKRLFVVMLVVGVIYIIGSLDWPSGPLYILKLALRPLALLILVWMGAYGLGDAVLMILRLDVRYGEDWPFAIGLGLAIGWLGLLLLGVLGLFAPIVAWAFLIGAAVFGVWRWPFSLARFEWQRFHLSWWSVALGVIIVVSALYPLFTFGLLPPLRWDEMAYHLAVPKIYAEAGQIVYVPFIVHSNWPFGLEMYYTLALLLGPAGEVLAHLLHWSLAILTAISLWSFSRHQKKLVGMLAAAIFLSYPVVKDFSGAAYVDVGLAAYSWLAFMAWYRWQASRARGWLVLAGLLAGAAASVKLTGAAIALILSAMTLFAATPRWRDRWINAAALGVIALVVVSPWYLKSWVTTGDPVWPFGMSIFPVRNWDALGEQYHLNYLHSSNMPASLLNYATGFVRVIIQPENFGGSGLGGIGLWSLFALGLLLGWRQRLVRWLMVFIVGYYTIWFTLTQQTRFLLPLLPMAAFVAAWGGAWLVDHFQVVGQLVVLGVLIWELPLVQAQSVAALTARLPYLEGQQSRADLLPQAIKAYPAFDFINHTLPAQARVLLATYENRGYYLDRPYVWANPISQRILRFEQMADGRALRAALAEQGIDYLLDNRHEWPPVLESIEYYDHLTQVLDELIAEYGDKMYESQGVVVYQLRPSGNGR